MKIIEKDEVEYTVSLRVKGEQFDTKILSATLGLTPKWEQIKGVLRLAPDGRQLGGNHPTNYVSYLLCKKRKGFLSEYLTETVASYERFEKIFHELKLKGNKVEFFVGWYGNGNIGDTLDSSLLNRLGSLGIDLSLDIYAY